MIPIGPMEDSAIRVFADLKRDRVLIEMPPGGAHATWITETEAEALAQHLQEAAAAVRRRRAEKG